MFFLNWRLGRFCCVVSANPSSLLPQRNLCHIHLASVSSPMSSVFWTRSVSLLKSYPLFLSLVKMRMKLKLISNFQLANTAWSKTCFTQFSSKLLIYSCINEFKPGFFSSKWFRDIINLCFKLMSCSSRFRYNFQIILHNGKNIKWC